MHFKVSSLKSCGLMGIQGYPVQVEVEVSMGLPGFKVVGLPDTTVSESRERVRCAIHSAGYPFPPDRVTVNLAPADVRKEGPLFDLPIALGILEAQKHIPQGLHDGLGVVGELSLDGAIRPVRGALSLAMTCRRQGLRGIILPRENAAEAALVDGIELWPVESLRETLDALTQGSIPTAPAASDTVPEPSEVPDMADIRGHLGARRAIEIAAAGGHNVLMVGPPGSGKTMLAQRLPGILPPLTLDEALEVTQIHSAAGMLRGAGLILQRPFRAPHHTASPGGIVGGGTVPRPGEISLAHGGVLFFDELPEFPRSVLEVLREPLESRHVTIARAGVTVSFPADFIFVACMNPCPCGYDGDRDRTCRCPRTTKARYRSRISGPLLDRIDIILEVPRQIGGTAGEGSPAILARVERAREVQARRLAGSKARNNAHMALSQLRRYCALAPETDATLVEVATMRGLSARATDRILRLSRTIADLADAPTIALEHVLEAVQLRSGVDLLMAPC